MSQKTNILYIGRNAEITTVVVRLLNNNEDWFGMGTTLDNEAQKLFMQHPFDIVLLGNGITKDEDLQLRAFFTKQNPAIKIVQHYGGGSGLLKSEILIALGNLNNL
ncbi:hypothetical protein Q765_17290 [Flavobacterium rivuli WB 3.3-2 = DSM 21788]|uniref:Response regulator receiver protein n=1 Tax=Flavobacterium rivuli WB 3.3-2 = DSM 21788 TaxID=1121895 RepID=A0A0A2LXZ7_9FLAO|nr:hypothetical protein [Flavobacterium rivuli]KGO85247.1 hypothetical protein Q765_17290 [Flavobacterium rivuli WB 3.3-2 = DSM 21788]